jgi:hypothetical protein
MERPGLSLFANPRGKSVVASAPMKLLCVLLLLSGRRPLEDTTDADLPEGRSTRPNKLKVGWIG